MLSLDSPRTQAFQHCPHGPSPLPLTAHLWQFHSQIHHKRLDGSVWRGFRFHGFIFGQGSCDAAVLADYPLRSRCVALCAVHVDITCSRLMMSYKENHRAQNELSQNKVSDHSKDSCCPFCQILLSI